MTERGTAPSPKQEKDPYGPGFAKWFAICPACGSRDYRMVDEFAISDWVWDAIETYGDPYVCNACNAHWVDPDFEQEIRWERPPPEAPPTPGVGGPYTSARVPAASEDVEKEKSDSRGGGVGLSKRSVRAHPFASTTSLVLMFLFGFWIWKRSQR